MDSPSADCCLFGLIPAGNGPLFCPMEVPLSRSRRFRCSDCRPELGFGSDASACSPIPGLVRRAAGSLSIDDFSTAKTCNQTRRRRSNYFGRIVCSRASAKSCIGPGNVRVGRLRELVIFFMSKRGCPGGSTASPVGNWYCRLSCSTAPRFSDRSRILTQSIKPSRGTLVGLRSDYVPMRGHSCRPCPISLSPVTKAAGWCEQEATRRKIERRQGMQGCDQDSATRFSFYRPTAYARVDRLVSLDSQTTISVVRRNACRLSPNVLLWDRLFS
jgi:hypothetical protein